MGSASACFGRSFNCTILEATPPAARTWLTYIINCIQHTWITCNVNQVCESAEQIGMAIPTSSRLVTASYLVAPPRHPPRTSQLSRGEHSAILGRCLCQVQGFCQHCRWLREVHSSCLEAQPAAWGPDPQPRPMSHHVTPKVLPTFPAPAGYQNFQPSCQPFTFASVCQDQLL